MSNDTPLSRPELDDRIAILQDNFFRQLVEQAAGRLVAKPRNGTPIVSRNSAKSSR